MLKDWLQLLCISTIPLKIKRALVSHFQTPREIFSAPRSELQAFGLSLQALSAITNPSAHAQQRVEKDFVKLKSLGADFVPFNSAQYSPLLEQTDGGPLGLFVRGKTELLSSPQLAIVGSRNASPAGVKITQKMARQLVQLGYTLTSGLASGIDSAAHQGALLEEGMTIGVLGTGIDQVYPRSNATLYQKIVNHGLLVSEFLPGSPPKREHFPRRNRIISGLSLGVIVMEADMKSGSLITARLAAEQSREVFAVPGPIYSATSKGCHYLIRNGAKLVETVEDIVEELGHFDICPLDKKGDICDKTEKITNAIYKFIDYDPISMNKLIEVSDLNPDQISGDILELELAGLISETPRGYVRLP